MRSRLKKRYPRDNRNHKRWVWVVRCIATDGTDQGDTIGYWTTDSRDAWRPRKYRGKRLPRLSEKQAHDCLRKFDEQIEHGKQDKPTSAEWAVFVGDFLNRTRGTVKITTLKEYRISLEVFGDLCAPSSPRTVNQRAVKRFIQRAKDSGRRDATVNKYLDSLRRVWNSEFPNNPNPFKSSRSERQGGVRRFKVPNREWHRTTPEDLTKLLKVCDHRWQGIVLLSYTAALREGEIWNLAWSDLALDKMTVFVNPKEMSETTWRWTPKDHERRTLPLTVEAKLALLRLKRADECPYVFVPPDRWRYLLNNLAIIDSSGFAVLNNFLLQYHARCRWAEVPEDDFHSLRKTCITNWLEAGVPPHEVQRLAGHSSVETTMKYYAKVDRSAIDRARRASTAYTKPKRGSHAG